MLAGPALPLPEAVAGPALQRHRASNSRTVVS